MSAVKTRKVKIIYPETPEDYAGFYGAVALDMARTDRPKLRCVTDWDLHTQIPFQLCSPEPLSIEDVKRLMDFIHPAVERLAGTCVKVRVSKHLARLEYSLRISKRIENAVRRFTWPERFTPTMVNLENLSTAPLQ